MHAPIRRTEMSEEAFQILFDIMERHFAALRIPDSPESDQAKLTRALSFSGLPSTRRIFIEQCYKDGDSPNLVRQYSCEQILDQNTRTSQVKFSEVMRAGKDEHVKTWGSTVPYHDSGFKIPNWTVQSKKDTVPSTPPPTPADDRVEYMEVEEESDCTNRKTFVFPAPPTSCSSVVSLENSHSKSDENFAKPILTERKFAKQDNSDCANESDECKKKPTSYQDMKDKIRPLVSKRPPKTKAKSMCSCALFFLLLSSILVVLISILLQQNHKHSSDFTNAVVELRKQIHGQDRAVQVLSEYLQLDAPPLKVIALVGGTGVGKSYTVEIIKKNFPRPYSVRQYFPPIGAVTSISLFLHPTLIILENLREHDLPDVANFLKAHLRDAHEDRHVTVLLVLNIEQMDDDSTRSIDLNRGLDTIKSFLADDNNEVKIIPYDTLNEDALEKCITNAARDSELTLTDRQIDLIKRNLLTNKAGCKGAYGKVQVIGRQ